MTTTPTSRQKARRESVSSTAAGGSVRVRKSSVSGASGSNTMRPRANTISHVDNATLGMIAAANSLVARHGGMELNIGHGQQSNLPGVSGYQFRGMSTAAGNHGNPHVLPKLDTNNFNVDVGASMRTAPPYTNLGGGIDMDSLWYGQGNTVNPAQLHFSHSPQALSFDPTPSPYNHSFPNVSHHQTGIDDSNTFAWMSGFDNQMSFDNANEQAIDGSSPSAMSTGSHSGLSELILDATSNAMQSSELWQTPIMEHTSLAPSYSMDFPGPILSDYYQSDQQSPRVLHAQMGTNDHYFSSPPPLNPQTPVHFPYSVNGHFERAPMAHVETPSNSAASVSSSNRQSSVTSVSADSLTDTTRQALLASLSQPSVFGHNHFKTAQPSISSPLSPAFATKPQSASHVPLPSTYDLQRYIAAYIKYFHPHLPFLHIPTLSFDTPDFTEVIRAPSGNTGLGQPGIAGGAGSLILAMAAIGAFYEYENQASKDLFEMAKKLIHLYLEERRKACKSAGPGGCMANNDSSSQPTPLWLVQAMLLNVIYGHNCGDKTAAGIATTHCAALVSLARAAGLAGPLRMTSMQQVPGLQAQYAATGDMPARAGECGMDQCNHPQRYASLDLYKDWQNWRNIEERKRTLYAIFILSSLLVSAYNHAPALMNSEIRLDLPCDEELWAAETADAWASLKSLPGAEQNVLPFSSALSSFLTASHRHPYRHAYGYDQPFGSSQNMEDLPQSHLRPSTFGCLVLINALHNYIWETRQRHMGRPWTVRESEAMHAHIEPALRAWQAAWASSPQHSLERPNPFGAGSLSADCIPLLDLAYVRLFVNLGRSKEAFFQRDWQAMANELAHGHELVQHADSSPDDCTIQQSHDAAIQLDPGNAPRNPQAKDPKPQDALSPENDQLSLRRERHLRKAAYFAANSLAMSDKLGVTFADFSSRELPIQSALCAFDCAQVLAEWYAAVQERVGRHIGIVGKEEMDVSQGPAAVLLSEDDCKLFKKMHDIIRSAEIKMSDSNSISATQALQSNNSVLSMSEHGYGSKILLITAHMLEQAAVWPVTREMAQSLQVQAAHMYERAQNSTISI
ncbi:MAG: hypothetical protein Q9205_001558 [Flavoplaca limonia]